MQLTKLSYNYRLNENAETDSSCIFNVNLYKNTWATFKQREPKLDKMIRSKSNPNGILDFEIVSIINGRRVVEECSKDLFEKELPKYTIQDLSFLNRKQLVEIAKVYAISPINKVPKVLIQHILDKQEIYGKALETAN